LIDVRDDSHIWGERYGRKVSEVVALPQQISRDVSQRLRSRTDNMDHAQLTRNYSPDSEAYRLYLQGRYNWNKRTVQGLQNGIEYFGKAIQRDQDYALAYAGLADCYLLLNVYNVAPADDSFPKAEAASRKALSINESLAEAHTALGFVTYRYHLKWAEAEEHFKKAIALNPNYATAHQWYGSYLAASGRLNEAVVEAKTAHDLEPFSLTIYSDYIRSLYYAGRLDEARKESLKLMETDPSFARAHYELGLVLEEAGTVIGCGALHLYGPHLAEIRSITVDRDFQKRGGGELLVQSLMSEARKHQVSCICLFTRSPQFFSKLGFDVALREDLPDKINKDCCVCPRYHACDEVAMVKGELPRFAILPEPTSWLVKLEA